MIVGWIELAKYVGRCEDYMRTCVQHRGFPKGTRLKRQGHWCRAWTQIEVDIWIKANE